MTVFTKETTWRFLFRALVVACYGAVFTACNEDDSQVKEKHVGEIRPMGVTKGDAENFIVGPEGGTINSATGMVTIDIPGGAVQSSATLRIQEVENTAPNGVGRSFKISSDDVTFQKPVTITFAYDDRISYADGLGVAYQDDDGVWYWPGNLKNDKQGRRITVQATDFSAWALFESMYLIPSEAAVPVNGEIELEALRVLPSDVADDLLTPLVLDQPIPLGKSVPLEQKYIKQWSLIGKGNLQSSGSMATYTAPATLPDVNPETITLEVDLENGSKAFLLSYISVSGCRITLTGGPYSNSVFVDEHTAMGNNISFPDRIMITFAGESATGNDVLVSVYYPAKGTGQAAWNGTTCGVYTSQVVGANVVAGSCMLSAEDPPIPHPGFVNISIYDEAQGIIAGSFSGNFSIVEFCLPDPCISYGTVEGSFVALTR